MDIKISIIVPFYNVELYIVQCLDSILRHKRTDIEVLLVDDCGTDSSRSIAERYAKVDNRVKVLTHSVNKGLGGARNTGVGQAKGEYVWFVDSDDTIAYGSLDKLCELAVPSASQAILFDSYSFFDGNVHKKKKNDYMGNTSNLPCVRDGQSLVFEEQSHKNALLTRIVSHFCAVWSVLFNRQFLIDNNLKFIENTLFEDNITIFWLYKCHRIEYLIDCVFYCYRIRPNSTMTAKFDTNRYKHNIAMVYEILSYINDDNSVLLYLGWQRVLEMIFGYNNQNFVLLPASHKKQAIEQATQALLYAKTKMQCDRQTVIDALRTIIWSKRHCAKFATQFCNDSVDIDKLHKAVQKTISVRKAKLIKVIKAVVPNNIVQWLKHKLKDKK